MNDKDKKKDSGVTENKGGMPPRMSFEGVKKKLPPSTSVWGPKPKGQMPHAVSSGANRQKTKKPNFSWETGFSGNHTEKSLMSDKKKRMPESGFNTDRIIPEQRPENQSEIEFPKAGTEKHRNVPDENGMRHHFPYMSGKSSNNGFSPEYGEPDEDKPGFIRKFKNWIISAVITGLIGLCVFYLSLESNIDLTVDINNPSSTHYNGGQNVDDSSEEDRPSDDLLVDDSDAGEVPLDAGEIYTRLQPVKSLKYSIQFWLEDERFRNYSSPTVQTLAYLKKIEIDPLSLTNISEEEYNRRYDEGEEFEIQDLIKNKIKGFIIPVLNCQIDSRLNEIEAARQVVGKKKLNANEVDQAKDKIRDDLLNTVAVGLAGLELYQIDRDALDRYKKRIRNQFPTKEAYQKWVKNFYGDGENPDKWFRVELAGKEYISDIRARIQISDAEVAEFYDTNRMGFEVSEKMRIRQIFLKVSDGGSGRTRASQKERIEALRRRINQGESFEQLAKIFSKGGGAVIDVERGELTKAMEETVFPLSCGQVSPVFESNRGFHIFKIEKYIPQHVIPLNEVRPQITERLRSDRFNLMYPQMLHQLREKLIIKYS